ncbi:MAG: universal stress protein [Nitrospirae bacterium]|nr:universal stress protein [Nitrospirota bacterium]
MKIMVAYDGTLQAKDALRFGMEKAKETGAKVDVLSVFDSGLYIDTEASLDAVDVARAQAAKSVADAKAIIKEAGKGVDVSLYTAEGDTETAILDFAREGNVDLLLCTSRQKGIIEKYRKAVEARGKKAAETMEFGAKAAAKAA